MSLSGPAYTHCSSARDLDSLITHPKVSITSGSRRKCETEPCSQEYYLLYRLRSVRMHALTTEIFLAHYTDTPKVLVDLYAAGILAKKAKHYAPLNHRKRANSSTSAPYQPEIGHGERDSHDSAPSEGYTSQAFSPGHLQEVREKRKVTAKVNPTKQDIAASDIIDPLSSDGVILGKVAELNTASYLNAYALYMTMSIGAVSGAALFSWEQSVETVDMAPIIPITLFWTTILCTLGLPLSLLVADEIKDLQAAVRECSERCKLGGHEGSGALKSINGIHLDISTEKSGRRARSGGGEPRSDIEDSMPIKIKCKCVRCMSKARRCGIYCVLFLAPVFTGISFVTSIMSLVALIFVTEDHMTSVIATSFCVPAAVAFLVALFWLLYWRSRWDGEA